MNQTITHRLCHYGLLLCLLCGYSASVSAMAHCALRDPVKSIYALFPEADAYRSNVQTVGRSARNAVIEALPFKLHFNELGRHTLYIALKETKTIGFVHARSELGEWGLTEYAWAIDANGRIADVKVQRSRDPYVRNADINKLRALVRGRNLQELKTEFSRTGKTSLERGVISSAMKTLVITRAVWDQEWDEARASEIARSIDTNAHRLTRISGLYNQETQGRLVEMGMRESPAFRRAKNKGFRVEDSSGEPIALLIHTPFDMDDSMRSLWWYVGKDGEINGVVDEKTMEIDQTFTSALGYAPQKLGDCSSLADLAALEITALSQRQSED